MAKQVKQFRYYGDGDARNYPGTNDVSKNPMRRSTLKSGSVFSEYMPIIQLGIQAYPGIKFYINNSSNPVIVGQTGIYELNVDGLSEITSLRFDGTTLDAVEKSVTGNTVVGSRTAYDPTTNTAATGIGTSAGVTNFSIIVDVIYEDGEE